MIGLLVFVVASVGLCWFIHRTFYLSDHGTRPLLAFGCTTLVFIGCVLIGLMGLLAGAIGGSAGF